MPAETPILRPDDPDILRDPGHAPEAQPPSPVHQVFLGADGLRAGWSLLLFSLLLSLLFAPAFRLLSHVSAEHRTSASTTATSAPREEPVSQALLQDGILFAAVLLATAAMSRLERRPIAAYGIGPSPRSPRHFLHGLLWGLLLLSVLIVILKLTHLLVFDARLLAGASIPRFGSEWAVVFLFVGLFEESLFRGFILFTLARGLSGIYDAIFKTTHRDALGFWTAAVLLAAAFGLVHRSNPGESSIGLLTASLAALVFSFSLWRTGSLWWAIGFHASWDWSQSFLYGVGDSGGIMQHRFFATHPVGPPLLSGGLTGPEGSIFALPVLGAIAIVIWKTLPQAPRTIPLDQVQPSPRSPDRLS